MEPDGIFVDCLIPGSCYCPRCIEKMKAMGIDISDDNAVYMYSVSLIKEVVQEITITKKDGYTELILPEITGYKPFLLVK